MGKFDLNKVALWKNLNKKELALVSHFLLTKKYQSGEMIFTKGSPREKMIIITEGEVALKTDLYGEETIALFHSHDFLGEMSLLQKNSHHEHSLEVISHQLSTVELTSHSWSTLLKKEPALATKIYHNIAIAIQRRLYHANNKLVALFATGKVIASYSSLPEVATHILNIILKIIPSQKAILTTFSSASQQLIWRRVIGYKNIKENTSYNLSQDALLKKIVANPSTVIIGKNKIPKQDKGLPYASQWSIITPIQIQANVIGFIILADKKNNHDFSLNNKILLQTIASQTAPAIEHFCAQELAAGAAEAKKIYIDPFSGY
jgi:CRP-like cAMP-binding protein